MIIVVMGVSGAGKNRDRGKKTFGGDRVIARTAHEKGRLKVESRLPHAVLRQRAVCEQHIAGHELDQLIGA